jgi:hypothetical protein
MKSCLVKNIPDELWSKFKSKLNKNITINEAIIELIRKEVEDNA